MCSVYETVRELAILITHNEASCQSQRFLKNAVSSYGRLKKSMGFAGRRYLQQIQDALKCHKSKAPMQETMEIRQQSRLKPLLSQGMMVGVEAQKQFTEFCSAWLMCCSPQGKCPRVPTSTCLLNRGSTSNRMNSNPAGSTSLGPEVQLNFWLESSLAPSAKLSSSRTFTLAQRYLTLS